MKYVTLFGFLRENLAWQSFVRNVVCQRQQRLDKMAFFSNFILVCFNYLLFCFKRRLSSERVAVCYIFVWRKCFNGTQVIQKMLFLKWRRRMKKGWLIYKGLILWFSFQDNYYCLGKRNLFFVIRMQKKKKFNQQRFFLNVNI